MTRTERRTTGPQGFLHWILPLMLLVVALTVLLSGRDMSQMRPDGAGGGDMYLHPAVAWIQRGVSLLLLLISAERLVNHVVTRKHLPQPLLAFAFITFWTATVATPALFGAHPRVSHDYLYPLIIGMAALLSTEIDRERVVGAARDALFVFMLGGAAMAAVKPGLVLDTNYAQGLLPGVPRFAGLAPHAVALGIFAQGFLLCLWVRPFQRRWIHVLGWVLGLGVLFFAQSKTAWIGFVLCATAMVAVRHGGNVWRRMGDPRHGAFGIVICLAGVAAVAAVLALVLVADLGQEAASFVQTPEGAELMTMTGRDRIWAIALEEWRASPVFGYGPTLWDDAFRASINMPNATDAHNQFMDTLARSGLVGEAALVVYSGVLLVLSLRAAKATGGLSIALLIALALRSISEVPLLMFGYGTELFTHLLLIVTLASAHASRTAVQVRAPRHASFRTAA